MIKGFWELIAKTKMITYSISEKKHMINVIIIRKIT